MYDVPIHALLARDAVRRRVGGTTPEPPRRPRRRRAVVLAVRRASARRLAALALRLDPCADPRLSSARAR
jgi:hypothetical protein